MQEKGLEPSLYCYNRHLKPARLPIPPLLHRGISADLLILPSFSAFVNRFFAKTRSVCQAYPAARPNSSMPHVRIRLSSWNLQEYRNHFP